MNYLRGEPVDLAFICSSLLKIITFSFALILLESYRRLGKRSSAILFLFWGLLTIANFFSYRSLLLRVFFYDSELVNIFYFITEMIYFPLVVCQLFLSSFRDNYPYKYDTNKNVCPLDEESFLSRLLFSWCTELLCRGLRNLIDFNDLSPIHETFTANYCFRKFQKRHEKEAPKITAEENHYKSSSSSLKETSKSDNKQPSIVRALFRGFWFALLLGTILEFLYSLVRFIPPLLINNMIDFVVNDDPTWKGYFYTFLLFLSSLLSNFTINHLVYYMVVTAIQVKSALISAVYRKSLKISSSTRRKYTVGELVNLMAVDAERLFQLSMFFSLIWGAPLRVFLTIVFLWQYLGPSCLAGVAVMGLMLPITAIIANKNRIVQEKQMIAKDDRLKFMNEILSGIKVLKLYAWEEPFMDRITDIRNKEVSLLKKFSYFNASVSFVWGCSPFLIAVSSFVTFVMVDDKNILDPATAFVSLTLFNMLRFSLVMIPDLISNLIQTRVSLRRLHEFLISEELDPDCVGKYPDLDDTITVREANFTWSKDEQPVLKDINLKVKTGQLLAVVGQVGSGKSSLLSAILGEMYNIKGKVDLVGETAYVPQQAWIQNATLQQNILFMRRYDSALYDEILDNCSLRPDLEILSGGDQIEIGEKGVNLSGGQKQRVSLARAVYQNADIYLLDDPLSAVDSHVGKHIFQHVIGPKGMLKSKTRVLVTHAVSVLPEVDMIVVLKDGKIQEMGTYKELLEKGGSFAEFLQEHLRTENVVTDKENEETDPKIPISRTTSLERSISRQFSTLSQRSESKELTVVNPISGQLIEEEKMEIGKVKTAIYLKYLKHIGLQFTIPIVVSYILYQGFEIGSNLWLSVWSEDEPLPNGLQNIPLRNTRIIIYAIFGVVEGIAMLVGAMLLAAGTMRASGILHRRMLDYVMRAPMYFFDTTPLGRILNRFGKDIDVVDTQIPLCFDSWIYCFLSVLGTLIIISINSPLFVVSVIPIIIFYYFLQMMYLATSRQLKRMESVTRSPIYNNFSETINGVSSIRAYRVQKHFTNRADERVDVNQTCYFHSLAVNRWLGIRLEFLGSFILLATALLVVWARDDMDSGIVGLNLSYALGVTESFTWLVRMSAELETKIVSVERIDEYSQLESEAPWYLPSNKPDKIWPPTGKISFLNYSTRYRKGLDLVLKRINLNVEPQEKVGVVGRTGAGKSSLTLALFRIIEASGGAIVIDGIDISGIGLHDLRSKLTIIPQDPVLYTGSLRMNLDPLQEFTDDDIWTALEHAHLKSYVVTLSEGLDHTVSEGGENLSVGQRQLACLARALLRKTNILVLDEATAAIDLETDKLIQNTIRKEFSHCTVITIAHRLHTIMDSDRVIVLENGRIVENGNPDVLLQNSQTMFHSMAKDAGII
ncbi:multidrug resistance-associated protein 1-like [Centruroides vittatus]|uniref:multidrug resistance-associated protein 1-like n=1 Tax=Centruroides vittatus TaxID=120091 RepID=UPI00350F0C56